MIFFLLMKPKRKRMLKGRVRKRKTKLEREKISSHSERIASQTPDTIPTSHPFSTIEDGSFGSCSRTGSQSMSNQH